MALELLVQKIRADGEREVAAIRAESEAKVAAVESDARSRAETLYRRELDALRARLQFAARQEYSQREIEVRRALLQEREILLEEVRRRWETWLQSLAPADETQLLQRMLARAAGTVPEGAVIVSARTKELLGSAGKRAVEVDEALGDGIRVRSTDGRVVADLSFESVASEFWTRRRPAIAARLFGEAISIHGQAQ